MSKRKQPIIVKMSFKRLLPDIRSISDNDIIFQQDWTRTHRSRYITRLLDLHCHDVSESIEPKKNCSPNSPDLNSAIFWYAWGSIAEKMVS